MPPDDHYDRARSDNAIDRLDRRLEELGRTVGEQGSQLQVHVMECTGQRREVKFALEDLKRGQDRLLKVVLGVCAVSAALAIGLKSPLGEALMKMLGWV